jgi:hypothetical protein
MELNSKNIISSAKGIVDINPNKVFESGENSTNNQYKKSEQKRLIGLVDADCKKNCNNKKSNIEKVKKKEIPKEVIIDYR